MNSYGLGDLAQTFLLQRRGADIKTDVARLTEELASGQVSDTKSILSGNVAYLTDIESDLRSLSAYKVAGTEAAQFATSVQSALGRIDAGVEQLSTNLLSVAASASGPVLDHMSKDAESELQSLVSTLNTSSAGRSIFSGAATERPALSNADEILNDLRQQSLETPRYMMSKRRWSNGLTTQMVFVRRPTQGPIRRSSPSNWPKTNRSQSI